MESEFQCGSPTGMGQLIKYFESQSRRLNRQTIQSSTLSLNPDFESSIKFNGVPILPPAITSSRREELRQLKKDAVLLEKRLKARQRQELVERADSLINQSQVYFPDASSRQAARQLNFNSDGHEKSISTTDTDMKVEDFGLHTMDSITSDFMSLDSESIPRVFSGLTLTSVKEQKISYDLDRLSKALNVQDLASTSGSDLSDILDFSHTQDRVDLQDAKNEEDIQSAPSIEDKCLPEASNEQNTDPTVSLDDIKNTTTTGSELSEFVHNTGTTNFEHTHSSLNCSPDCVFSKAITTTEGTWSNKSSPKSQKSGVHFASFVTEYVNESTLQSQEYQTAVKKKLPSDHSVTQHEHDTDTVLPIIGDPSESRRKGLLSRKVSDGENGGGLLDKVSFSVEGDLSSVAPLFSKFSQMTLQSYARSETYTSDKENDVSQLFINLPQGHKRSLELGNKFKHYTDEKGCTESPAFGSKQNTSIGEEKKKDRSPGNKCRNRSEEKNAKNSLNSESLQADSLSVGRGREISQDVSTFLTAPGSVGSSHTTSLAESIPLVVESITLEAAPAEKLSVLRSQNSSRSNMLTDISESGSSANRVEFSKDRSSEAMNISGAGLHPISRKTDQKQEILDEDKEDSPKKLNIDPSIKETDLRDKCITPSQTNICRNSYTLSEPSPALVQAQGKLKSEKKEKNNEQRMSSEKHQNVQVFSPKRGHPAFGKETVDSKSHLKMAVPSQAETEGKAEHINKYLNQIQFQNSMNFSDQNWDTHHMSVEDSTENMEEPDETNSLTQGNVDGDCHVSMLDVLRSIAESQGSLEHLTIEELLDLHHRKMNERREALIRQQQRDMEELFVQQRREVMLLESEIKAAQQLEREQQKFLIQNAPENIKVKSRNRNNEYSPVHTGNFENADVKDWQQMSAPDKVSNNLQSQSFQQLPSGSQSSAASIKLEPKAYPGMDAKSGKLEQVKSKSLVQPRKDGVPYKSPDSTNADNQTHVKTTTGDNFHSRTVASISAMGIANRIAEFSPSVASPHLRRPVVLRSPLKYTSHHNYNHRVAVPPEAYLPEMQVKFDKVTAAAKGFLTRCLLKSDKVQELVKTIRDTRKFAYSFQTETPIKKGMFTSQDKVLLERIIAQLQAAVLDIHEIFFEISVPERMMLIEQTRLSQQEKRTKSTSRDNTRESGPKISQATLKALERKRKSREAETSAGISISRSRTAPPRTSSPLQSNHIESRALKPLQSSQFSPIKLDTNRIEKGHPDTAKEKPLTQPKRVISLSTKSVSVLVKTTSDTQKKGSVKLSSVANKPVVKSKNETKPSSRPSKSWR